MSWGRHLRREMDHAGYMTELPEARVAGPMTTIVSRACRTLPPVPAAVPAQSAPSPDPFRSLLLRTIPPIHRQIPPEDNYRQRNKSADSPSLRSATALK